MSAISTAALQASAQRLFPDRSLDQVIAELLLERAQKNLIKYQVAARQFEGKYERPFDAFRQEILSTEPSFEVEQDYFDWELAVTGISDMQREIQRLKGLSGNA
jgi:tRNA U34 5-carboxymethylaminomethyl modifying GTPase MnmE/TrmE